MEKEDTIPTDDEERKKYGRTRVVDVPKVKFVAVGYSHTCVITEADAVLCFGGSVETYTADPKPTPVAVSGAVELAAGKDFTCARMKDGRVKCWGAGLDDPETKKDAKDKKLDSKNKKITPLPFDVKDLPDAIGIAAAERTACALRKGGSVVCWGESLDGTDHVPKPKAVAGLVGGVQLAMGGGSLCVVDGGGGVRCAGSLGKYLERERGREGTISAVEGITDAAKIAVGALHACARTKTGAVRCFGWDEDGELGTGRPPTRLSPVRAIGLTSPNMLALARDHSCALAGGRVLCWGRGDREALGTGDHASRAVPAPVVGIDSVVSLAINDETGCVTLDGGQLRCWGRGAGEEKSSLRPAPVMGIGDAAEVALGSGHACIRRLSGKVSCWGDNHHGQLGTPPKKGDAAYKDVALRDVPGISDATILRSGGCRTCALRPSGQVTCWGCGDGGERGDGTNVQAGSSPSLVARVVDARSLVVGSTYACAFRKDGSLACWGGSALTPVDIDIEGQSIAAFGSTGRRACAAISGTGDLWCWGSSWNDDLGRTDSWSEMKPRKLTLVSQVAQIALGDSHACGVRMTGEVICWGDTRDGKLGEGMPSFLVTPTNPRF